MTTPNDPRYNREIQQTSYQDTDGRVHEVKKTTETVNQNADGSYSNGYEHGRAAERSYRRKTFAERDNDNTARGLLVGIFLAALAAFGGGLVWYASQRDEVETPVVVPVPDRNQNDTAPEARQNSDTNTTIIERTREVPVERTREVPVTIEKTREVPVPVPVPQQQAPQTQAPTSDTTGTSVDRTSVTDDPVLNESRSQTGTDTDTTGNTDTTNSTDTTSGSNTDTSNTNSGQ